MTTIRALLLATLLIPSGFLSAQILIGPANGGNFELGPSFADNGWTVVNGGTTPVNKWYVGTVPAGSNGNSAYISNTGGATHTYQFQNSGFPLTAGTEVYFYRTFTTPAVLDELFIEFRAFGQGEITAGPTYWDFMQVLIFPGAYVPVADDNNGAGLSGASSALWGNGAVGSDGDGRVFLTPSWTTLSFPCINPSTYGLAPNTTYVFAVGWNNGTINGTQPPGAIDDIRLIASGTPLAEDDFALTAAGSSISSSVLNNDTDPCGALDASTLTIDTPPSNGTAVVVGSTIQYTPDPGFTGNDQLVYEICDFTPNCVTATLRIQVLGELVIYQGISPNGDGFNDEWVIDGIEAYPNNSVKIFNRWGNLVYEAKGYDNVQKVWNGKANAGNLRVGDDLPDGTYFYHVDLGDGSKVRSGYVVLNTTN